MVINHVGGLDGEVLRPHHLPYQQPLAFRGHSELVQRTVYGFSFGQVFVSRRICVVALVVLQHALLMALFKSLIVGLKHVRHFGTGVDNRRNFQAEVLPFDAPRSVRAKMPGSQQKQSPVARLPLATVEKLAACGESLLGLWVGGLQFVKMAIHRLEPVIQVSLAGGVLSQLVHGLANRCVNCQYFILFGSEGYIFHVLLKKQMPEAPAALPPELVVGDGVVDLLVDSAITI
mmetsp:Transcript_28081/g.55239  ORF Transcript_28081/g.55239 Transcript_28081/m.55239 type:complete len:232 (+) Transcript_28081:1846-2541(+)